MTGRRRTGTGTFLAVEGIDGAGKSTFVRALARELRRRGQTVAVRREPSEPTLGRLAQHAGDPWTSAVYFTLDRFLAHPKLTADLARHRFVLQDRSYFSTLAYQGSLLALGPRRRLRELQARVTVVPDRVILLELPPALALLRVGRRSSVRAPFERRATLERVARAYRALARSPSWWTLDAGRPTRELVAETADRLLPVGRRGSGAPKKIRAGRLPRRRR